MQRRARTLSIYNLAVSRYLPWILSLQIPVYKAESIGTVVVSQEHSTTRRPLRRCTLERPWKEGWMDGLTAEWARSACLLSLATAIQLGSSVGAWGRRGAEWLRPARSLPISSERERVRESGQPEASACKATQGCKISGQCARFLPSKHQDSLVAKAMHQRPSDRDVP